MFPLTGASHRLMPFKVALCSVILFKSAVGEEAATVANCTSQGEGEAGGLAGTNCTFQTDQEKGLVGGSCTTATDCFEGLQCTPSKMCACPEGCDYIAEEVACSCGSEWADPGIIVFLTVGVPFNALVWFACFYRTSKVMKRNDDDDGYGSRATVMKAGTVDSYPLTAPAPTSPGSLFAVSEAGPVAKGPSLHPQWWSQATRTPNNLPLNTVPPPPTYYPQHF